MKKNFFFELWVTLLFADGAYYFFYTFSYRNLLSINEKSNFWLIVKKIINNDKKIFSQFQIKDLIINN